MASDTTAPVIVALLALGMALAFIVADRRSPTSQALSLFLTSIGVAIGVGVLVAAPTIAERGVPPWGGAFALPEMFAFIFAYEWLLRVRRTLPTRDLRTRGADNMLRVAQLLAVFYGAVSLIAPRLRSERFIAGRLDVHVNHSRLDI